jgi:signal transduction histidine kinase
MFGYDHSDDAIRTSVRDYGIGISKEARDRLFNHFFTTEAQGLGMGLQRALDRRITWRLARGRKRRWRWCAIQFILPANGWRSK